MQGTERLQDSMLLYSLLLAWPGIQSIVMQSGMIVNMIMIIS